MGIDFHEKKVETKPTSTTAVSSTPSTTTAGSTSTSASSSTAQDKESVFTKSPQSDTKGGGIFAGAKSGTTSTTAATATTSTNTTSATNTTNTTSSTTTTTTTQKTEKPAEKKAETKSTPQTQKMNTTAQTQKNEQKNHDPETVKTVKKNIASVLVSKDLKTGTKDVMSRYYEKHDPKFAKLSKQQKEKYLEKKLSEIVKTISPNVKEDEQKSALLKAVSLYTMAEVNKTSIEDIQKQGSEKINSMLKEMEAKQLDALIEKADPKNPVKSVEDFLKTTLETDENYAKLSDAEKEKFIKEKSNDFIKNTIGFDMSSLSDSSKQKVAFGAMEVIKELRSKNLGISDFMAMDPLAQAKTMNSALKKNPQLMQDKSVQLMSAQLETRADLMSNAVAAGKDVNNLKERDLYEEILKIPPEKRTAQQKQLLAGYERINKLPDMAKTQKERAELIKKRDRLLNDRADIKSNTVQRAFSGLSYAEHMRASVDKKYLNKQALLNDKNARNAYADVLKNEDKADALKFYNGDFLRGLGFNDKEIAQYRQKLFEEHPELATRIANRKMMDVDQTPKGQAQWDNIAASSDSKDMKELFKPLVQATASQYNQDDTVKYFEEQDDTTFYKDISTAVNQKDRDFGVEVEKKLAASKILTDDKKSYATQEMIATADADRQVYYAEEFAKIPNKAVTQGLIQAEIDVKPEVRANYSKLVEMAINQNGYDQQTKTELIQRRTEVLNTIAGLTSKSTTSTVNISSFAASANSRQFSRDFVTASNDTSTPQAINYGAQIVREIEKAALEGKKEEVLKRLEDTVENFQKAAKQVEDKKAKEMTEEEKKTENETVEKFIEEQKEVNGVKIEVIEKLKAAYSMDGMAGLYEKLGSLGLGADVQKKFLNQFAMKGSITSILGFANSYRGNDDIILTLFRYNSDPSLLGYLSSASIMRLLSQGKIKTKDFLKYAGKSQVAFYINELNKTGNTGKLREIISLMDLSERDYVASQYDKNGNHKGDDNFFRSIIDEQRNINNSYMTNISDNSQTGQIPHRNYKRNKFHLSA